MFWVLFRFHEKSFSQLTSSGFYYETYVEVRKPHLSRRKNAIQLISTDFFDQKLIALVIYLFRNLFWFLIKNDCMVSDWQIKMLLTWSTKFRNWARIMSTSSELWVIEELFRSGMAYKCAYIYICAKEAYKFLLLFLANICFCSRFSSSPNPVSKLPLLCWIKTEMKWLTKRNFE